MTSLELVQKHGYEDVAQAHKAIGEAQRWLRKHPGKRAPIHVQRAVDLVVDMDKVNRAEHARMQAKIAKLGRTSPRFWFGAIIAGSRFERARRWARRTFKLYLSPVQMAAHVSALVPDAFMRHWAGSDAAVRVKAIDSLADSVVKMYGLADGRNNPYAMVPQPRAGDEDLFAPWNVGKQVAWMVVAEKLKGATEG